MTAAPAAQTLALGHTLAERNSLLAQLGAFSHVRMVPPLEQIITVLAGLRGQGKSALVQACPGMFIFNFDIASTSLPDAQPIAAMMWPGRNSLTGQIVENDSSNDPTKGTSITLTWDNALAKQQLLIEMARNNTPGRPTTVALDTVSSMVELAMAWMVRDAAVHAKEGKVIEDFSDLDGRKAWPALYSHCVNFGMDLFRAGYGVVYMMHLGDKTVHLGENRKELLRDTPMLPDNLFNAIGNVADLVAAVEREESKLPVAVPRIGPDKKPIMGTDGKPLMEMKTTDRISYVLTLSPKSERVKNIVKQRGGLPPRIVLPRKNAWNHLSSLYRKAAEVPVEPA